MRRRSDGNLAFLGTCFCLFDESVFVSAAHCVGDLSPEDIVIVAPFLLGGPSNVVSLSRHPNADVIVLRVAHAGATAVLPVTGFASDATYGDEVIALGFPEDSSNLANPPGRFFRGHIQRFYAHRSYHGYQYHAAELSFGAPAGLSGGPVFLSSERGLIAGLVAENFKSSTVLSSHSEVEQNGNVHREEIHSVVNYAVCVWFTRLQHWLREVASA